MADEATTVDRLGWRSRPVVLALIGAVAARIAWGLLDRPWAPGTFVLPPAWKTALAAAVLTAAFGFGFAAERVRLAWAVAFAAAIGTVAGLVLYWNGDPGGSPYFWSWDWGSISLFLSIAIAAPLFQTARDEGAARWPYAEVHGHAWTNVVLWFACWIFVGLTMLLAWLLSELFQLIGLKFLSDLLEKGWFFCPLIGAAFGAALGLFRERERVVRLLQFVVTAVSSVLAPVLAVGLTVFLLALPFTGLGALWAATQQTTPILLSCVIAALILSNAVIGNGEPDEEPRNPVLRWSALLLAVEILPLAIIAAVATGLRIGQYGFTPDRLWGLVAVVVANAYGVAYLVTVARGRLAWAGLARPANLKLGFALCALTLVLALPIVSFNAISTRDQVARLESGRLSADRFDWAALAFDFGAPGRAALKKLASSGPAPVVARAKETLAAKSRWDMKTPDDRVRDAGLAGRIDRFPVVVRPVQVAIPQQLRRAAFAARLDDLELVVGDDQENCSIKRKVPCQIFWTPGATSAIVLQDECATVPPEQRIALNRKCGLYISALKYAGGDWRDTNWKPDRPKLTPEEARASRAKDRAALDRGDLSVRTVQRRQFFIGDEPQGEPFE